MEKEEALKIAAAYQDQLRFSTRVDSATSAILYDSFTDVKGAAWLIEAALPPSNFEGSDTITYVVSVNEKCVKFIINSSGFVKYPHEDSPGFTDEELEDLKNSGFDITE